MVPKLAIGLLVLLPIVPVGLALDLTPRTGFRDLEGVRIPVVVFRDEGRTFTYEPPPDWSLSGSQETLTFRPDNPLWSARWQVIRDTTLRGTDLESMTELSLRDVPDASSDASVASVRRNTLILEGIGSREIVVDYSLGERKYRRCTIFLDLDERQQLQVRVTAPMSDFEKAYEAMRRSFYSFERK